MGKYNSPEEIERILLFYKTAKENNPEITSLPTLKTLTNAEFQAARAATDYSAYVHFAHHHYTVARLLFIMSFWLYAHYCSQQTVENYLKAYLKLTGTEPPLRHSLKELLSLCRKTPNTPDFIGTEFIEAIVQKFDPYNELPRYPVGQRRPAEPGLQSIYPEDMYILDYFVFRMRGIVALPGTHSDIFKDGVGPWALYLSDWFPALFQKLKEDNINFE